MSNSVNLTKSGEKSKRHRVSMDLSPYPEVIRMIERLKAERKGVNQTVVLVDVMRDWLTKNGYARKKDLAAN